MKRVIKFAGVGVSLTLLDYVVFEIIAVWIFGGNTGLTWLATIISGLIATLVGYALHNKITWKERDPGKYGIIKFIVSNAVIVLAIRPVLAQLWQLATPIYVFISGIVAALNLPFGYSFIESTTTFVLMTLSIMVFKFLIYEKLVFGEEKYIENWLQKVNVKGIRKPGKKQQG